MKVLLVGANGYGANFLNPLYELHQSGRIVFEGIVTRSAFPMQEELAAAGIHGYKTLEDFYAEHTADLAVISTPSFLHREQSIFCVRHGTNVICEKPAAPTVEDVEAMIQAEKETGKFIAIGYQRCFNNVILKLKQDILKGVFGKPVSAKATFSAPRNFAYYHRGGSYAGNIATKDGKIILDSPVANACAHYVQEMLFLLGDEMDTAANPTLVQGECYRANDITNFDTCCLKLTIRDNVPVYFSTSHAVQVKTEIYMHYEFENAVIDLEGGHLYAVFNDGDVKDYGMIKDSYDNKILHCIDAIENGTQPVCTVKTALPHVKMIGDIYKQIPVANFPEAEIVRLEDKLYVHGLRGKIKEAYQKACMLSEL